MIHASLLAALLGAALSPAEGVEPPPAFELSWTGPAGCPSGDVVAAKIGALLGSEVGPPADGPVRATATVRPVASGLELELLLDTSAVPRVLEAPTCDELAEATALIIAIAVDPDLADRDDPPATAEPGPPPATSPPPADEPTTTPEAAPAAPAPLSTTAAAATPPSRTGAADAAPRGPSTLPIGLHVRVDGGLVWNLLPGAAGNVGVSAGLRDRGWRLELGAAYALPREKAANGAPPVGGRFQALTGHLRGCGVPRVQSFEFPLCAELQAGAVFGRGTGDIEPVSATAAWAGIAAGPGVAWAPRRANGRLALLGSLDAVAALARPAFDTQASGLVHRAGPAGVQAKLGVELRTR